MNEKFNRRNLFKLTLGAAALPLLSKINPLAIDESFAKKVSKQCPDISKLPAKVSKKLADPEKKHKKKLYVHNIDDGAKRVLEVKKHKSYAKKQKETFKKMSKKKVAPAKQELVSMKCLDCKFYKKADKVTKGMGQCPMLANTYVSACGWCKQYSWKG